MSDIDTTRRSLTIPQAAKMLGIGNWALRTAIKNGEVPALKLGRNIRVSSVWIERKLAEADGIAA